MDEKRQLADKFMLRLPNGMRERIKGAAEENGRSMNAEIVRVLEREFPPPQPDSETQALLDTLDAMPKEAVLDFLNDWLSKNVSDQDIEDGIVPGVRSKK